jgi:hypothetical protein
MEDNQIHICPWCDHEIVWDPDIGAEANCPNCDNELAGYRSINVSLLDGEEDHDEDSHPTEAGKSIDPKRHATVTNLFAEPSPASTSSDDSWDDNDSEELPERVVYLANALKITDQQIEAPECLACYQFMVFAGVEHIEATHLTREHSPLTGKPLLPSNADLDTYVCPNCFKVEKYLSKATRQLWIKNIE